MTVTTIPFEPGHVSILPDAAEALKESGEDARLYLDRHVSGDWGELSRADASANRLALVIGGELLSCYRTSLGTTLWIMTEADRSATYIFLHGIPGNGDEMEKDDRESEVVFGSFTSAAGLALGELLLFSGRPTALEECLAAIEFVARATLLASDLGTEGLGRKPKAKSLTSVALKVVRVWHEETDGLSALAEAVDELNDVLKAMGVRYVAPLAIEE